jgi:hypothetical protein
MRLSCIVFALILTSVAAGATPGGECTAIQILDYYFSLPCPDPDPMGEGRGERLDVLRQLWKRPEESAAAIAEVLPQVEVRVHRLELIETLGRLPTQQSADILIPLLDDPDGAVRVQALKGLRLLASRIRRAGVVNVSREPEFPPAVEGLLPYLIEAANDKNDGFRSLALWALADTREPEAADEIRRHLQDSNPGIRFRAACFLAEFGDDSGLPELRLALERLSREDGKSAGAYHFEAEHLFASFQRITGESMGGIPMNPMLSSSFATMEGLEERYDEMLQAWVDWWAEYDRDAGVNDRNTK